MQYGWRSDRPSSDVVNRYLIDLHLIEQLMRKWLDLMPRLKLKITSGTWWYLIIGFVHMYWKLYAITFFIEYHIWLKQKKTILFSIFFLLLLCPSYFSTLGLFATQPGDPVVTSKLGPATKNCLHKYPTDHSNSNLLQETLITLVESNWQW